LDTKETLLPVERDAETAGTAPDTVAARKMDRSLIRSVAWNAAGDWISQIFSWAAFLIVTRLLTPADFGIVAMAGTLGPFVQYFSGTGIPRAIVTLRDLTEEQLAQLNSVGLLLGIVSFGLAALLAKPVAMFYGNPRVTPIIIVSCVGLVFNGVQAVSNGLLLKAMRFRSLSLFAAVGAVLNAAATLLFAWLGWGYWALVLGGFPGLVLRTALVMGTRRQTYAMPHWSAVKPAIQFSVYVVFSMIALSVYQNLDNVTAGRMLGQTALGLYGMAWILAYVPLDKVTSLVMIVVPTYFAAFQKDLAAVRRTLSNLTEGCALLMFPACVGLGIIAHDFVQLVLGPKWEGAAAPLQVLAIYAAFRSIVALLPRVLTSLGHARYVMWNDVAAIVILGLAFYTGSRWGTVGIAWGWIVCYPLVAIPLYHKTLATIEMNLKDYVRRLLPALEATLVMTIAVECSKYAFSNSGLRIRLSLEICVGLFFYAGTLWLRHRNRVLAFAQMAKSVCRS
jgi:teichuronic acid exporter